MGGGSFDQVGQAFGRVGLGDGAGAGGHAGQALGIGQQLLQGAGHGVDGELAFTSDLGAAGLDVYEEENANVYQNRSGAVIDSVTARLCSFPNVVMTSHQAFFTREALSQIARVTLDNAVAYANGTDYVEKSVVC